MENERLKQLRKELFLLEVKDHWTKEDFAKSDKLVLEIKQILRSQNLSMPILPK